MEKLLLKREGLGTFLQTQFPGRTKLKAESSKVLEFAKVFVISKPNRVDPNNFFPNFPIKAAQNYEIFFGRFWNGRVI